VFDHVAIRVSDRAASERFYDLVLSTIDVEWRDELRLAQATDHAPVTRRLHVGFTASAREHVDEFWRAGTAAGFRDDGPPGPRPQYSDSYYGAFLLDPDGNSIEAVHHDSVQTRGRIDHVWMRVADVAAAKRFYETIAPFTGFELRVDKPTQASFRGAGAGFTLVPGPPTEHAHLAFPARQNTTVEAFAGSYGAYVLDPDGNSVEVVGRNRDA
jgi:catechol 2,3-dioxygenase-like lactoylglutathione lyase family enzyme